MATWHTWGHSGYITPTVSGVRNVQRGHKKKIWLPSRHFCFLPLGRKARCTLSGRGGVATRPPATLSCKAKPCVIARQNRPPEANKRVYAFIFATFPVLAPFGPFIDVY